MNFSGVIAIILNLSALPAPTGVTGMMNVCMNVLFLFKTASHINLCCISKP